MRSEVSPTKAYFIQLYGFLVKTCTQRMRSPLSTLSTILIPFLFMLLMGVCYWTSEMVTTPEKWFSVGKQTDISNTTFNVSTITESFFCRHPESALPLVWKTCRFPAAMLHCIDFVGSGKDLCVPTVMEAGLSGFLNSMYYYSGSLTLNPMDSHLSISAFTRMEREKYDITYFGRDARESLTHYGELVVASEDEDLAEAFMTYCREQSGMCRTVLNSQVFSSFSAAESYALEHSDQVWAVVHLPADLLTSTSDEVVYTISMNYTATPWTFKDKVQNLFSAPAAGSDPYVLYWSSGFMTLQQFVQEFVLQKQMADHADLLTGPAQYDEISLFLNRWSAAVVPMPTPETRSNGFLAKWGYYLPLICALAALFPVAHLTALIVEEKPSGIREAMLIMGMHHTCMFAGWYLTSLVMDVVAALLVAMILKLGFLPNVAYSILFVVYFSFQQSNTALSLLMSSLFSNPRIAGWCAALTVFVFVMPYYTFPSGMKDSAYWGASTVPCVGFSVAIGKLTSYVTFEADVNWSMARYGEFSVVDAIGMIWVGFVVMMLLALYLDRVWPAAVGRREPALFFLRYFWCGCCRPAEDPEPFALYGSERKRVAEKTGEAVGTAEADVESLSGASCDDLELIEHRDEVVDPLDEDVPVVFQDVTMVYITGGLLGFLYTLFTGLFREGDYRLALRKVSFALHRGEVSTLLGPNGSGKTTIMSLATSMRAAQSGRVYVAGRNVEEDFGGSRRFIGYCPQENIVWADLTVEEHLRFYARLKGAASVEVSEAVERALGVIGLAEKRGQQAGRLSGGEQRRLCVGVALVGDSKVLFMDEPTAGLDVKGRREVYRVIQRAREGRSVLISTHLLDEADRLGDRLLVLNNGELCAEGSSMYLKSKMRVGYKVTCVMESGLPEAEEEAAVAGLIDAVRELGSPVHQHAVCDEAVQAVPSDCALLGLERRGREVTFMFPLAFLSVSGRHILHELTEKRESLRVRSVGLSLTTLEDVFKTALLRQMGMEMKPMAPPTREGGCNPFAHTSDPEDTGIAAGVMLHAPDAEKRNDGEAHYVAEGWTRFFRDFRALFLKRVHYAKRDGKLVFFQVVLPVVFLVVALLINLAQSPMQPAITLDMRMYPNYQSTPSELYVTRASFVPRTNPDAFGVTSYTAASSYGSYYTPVVLAPTSPYAMNGAAQMDAELAKDLYSHEAPRYVGLALTNMQLQSGPPHNSTAVFHNSTYAHAAPQAINALYALSLSQLFGDNHVPKPVARNSPMHLGEFEKELVETNKQVMVGMFVILAFILIPANTISYIVHERATGVRHLQWLTGASMWAYWLSAFVFDLLCYVGTILLAYIIFLVFDRSEYTGRLFVGPALCTFLMFGVSSIPFSYMLSFFFKSPFRAQNVVLVVNFMFGFLWVTCESLLADSAFTFVKWATRILRVLPSVSFGEALYVLAGTNMGWLMRPTAAKTSLFNLLEFVEGGRGVFKGGVGTGLIYMGCMAVFATVMVALLEFLRWNRCAASLGSCCRSDSGAEADGVVRDESVAEEEERVCANATGPAEDCIAVQHLSKRYGLRGRAAVADVSLGVRRGEVLALLGLNGAGKTTTLSILSGQRAASSGAVYMNHCALSSDASRRFIGYCPQFDALLEKLTPREHLYLFARLRGMREECIEREVDRLIGELGLYSHRHQTAEALSGGNRRRLSLALALVGNTTSVLLDEPTAGMDAFARSQTCAVVKALTQDKSVILTTHLFDETEALADRVAILSSGRLRVIGSGQELKVRYGQRSKEDHVHMLRVHFPGTAVLDEECVGRLQRFIASSLSGAEPSEQATSEACVVDEVLGSGVKFVLHHSQMDAICDVVMALSERRVEGVPEMAYVSVTQPTMEDVLLAE